MSRGFVVALGTWPANAHLNPDGAACLSKSCLTAASLSESSMDFMKFQALEVTNIPHASSHHCVGTPRLRQAISPKALGEQTEHVPEVEISSGSP
jgi:hypothetical protein